MPLEDPQIIDIVRKTDAGKIVLVITDAGTVTEPVERVACLVKKLKNYIGSIVSGDLKRDFPDKTSQDYIIEVACRRRPTAGMLNISEVMPRKDPANRVPVRFIEFPAGSWELPKPEDFPSPAEVRRPKAPVGEKNELDPLSIAVLERGVELAENYLAEGEKGFYFAVLGWDESQTDTIIFREDSVTNGFVREVEQYVRRLTPEFTVCALASVEKVTEFSRGHREAMVLVLHCRGWGTGKVYARPVRRKNGVQKFGATDSLQLVGVRPGLLPG